MHAFLQYVTHHRVLTIGMAIGAAGVLSLASLLWETRRPRRRRAPAVVIEMQSRMRHRAPELPPAPPAPDPEPVDEPAAPVDHHGADVEWSPAAELADVGPGVLNRAALEEPTRAFVAVYPTDKQVDDAKWDAWWRTTDNRLEAERYRIKTALLALDLPGLADEMRAIDLRDAELHATAVTETDALVYDSGELRQVLDTQRVDV